MSPLHEAVPLDKLERQILSRLVTLEAQRGWVEMEEHDVVWSLWDTPEWLAAFGRLKSRGLVLGIDRSGTPYGVTPLARLALRLAVDATATWHFTLRAGSVRMKFTQLSAAVAELRQRVCVGRVRRGRIERHNTHGSMQATLWRSVLDGGAVEEEWLYVSRAELAEVEAACGKHDGPTFGPEEEWRDSRLSMDKARRNKPGGSNE